MEVLHGCTHVTADFGMNVYNSQLTIAWLSAPHSGVSVIESLSCVERQLWKLSSTTTGLLQLPLMQPSSQPSALPACLVYCQHA